MGKPEHGFDEDLAAWDRGVEGYLSVASGMDEFKESVDDPAFIGLLGDVSAKRMLDIGCGDGAFCRKLRAQGVYVTGLDGSPQMVKRAEANDWHGDYRIANVVEDDLPFRAEEFDIVTAKMMLMNVRSLTAVAANVRRVLKSGGLFAADVVHPFFPSQSAPESAIRYDRLDSYLEEVRGHVHIQPSGIALPFYYRPISRYVNDITREGFSLERMEEIGVDEAFGRHYPAHADKVNQPVTLHLLFGKAS